MTTRRVPIKIERQDVMDVIIQALEHDFPKAGVIGMPATNQVIFIHEDLAPEVVVIDIELAEVRPT